MSSNDRSRPIGATPIADAAALTAPIDQKSYASNADLRFSEDSSSSDAAMTATGEDIDNDHADERPINRSQDAPESHNADQNDEPQTLGEGDTEDVDEHGHRPRSQQFTGVE